MGDQQKEESLHKVAAIVVFLTTWSIATFAQSTVAGKLSGADGKPMARADVFLMRTTDTTCLRTVKAGPTGDYALTVDSTGIWLLRFTGVAHRERLVAVYLDRPQRLTVNVRLGTYSYLQGFPNVSVVGDFNRWYVPASVPMAKKRDGTYRAEVNATGPTISYQLNNVASGARIAGMGAVAYDYRRYEGYAAVVRAEHGKATIVFNPGKLPSAGKPGRITFVPPGSTAARFAAHYDNLQRIREAHIAAGTAARTNRGTAAKSFDLSGPLAEVQKQASREKSTILREELWVNYIALASMARSTDGAGYTMALQGVSPASIVWLLNPHGISNALLHSTLTEEQKAEYVAGVLQKSPAIEVKSALLLDEFMIARLSDRRDIARTYYDILVQQYGNTPEGKMVRERYSP